MSNECEASPTGQHERRDMAGDIHCKHCGAVAFPPKSINWDNALALWTIYDSPSDYPGQFVGRLFVVMDGESHATNKVLTSDTLDGVRAQLPPGLYRFGRAEIDEPQIVETWI